ncbi:MAG: TIGR03943 family protein [Verrucomicrobia bacterium]|nr:TIGR03943 family protein [Verrucomicrobiota bacterium]
MRARVFNFVNGITLIGVGAVLLDFFFTGRLDQYLHPQFRYWTLLAGVIFCVAGVVYAAGKTTSQCCIDGECVHQSANSPVRSLVAFLVLFVPLAAGVALSKDSYDQHAVLNRGFVQDITKLPSRSGSLPAPTPNDQVIPPQALGADMDERASEPLPQDTPSSPPDPNAVAKGGTGQANPAVPSSDDNGSQYLPKAADGNVALEVTDLLYAEAEDSLRKMFTDKTIEVIGQYLPGSDAKQFKLVRMFIVCCAADARPLAVPVEVSGPMTATEMGWVKVVGKPIFTQQGDRAHVVLKADKVESTDPPAEAMLY